MPPTSNSTCEHKYEPMKPKSKAKSPRKRQSNIVGNSSPVQVQRRVEALASENHGETDEMDAREISESSVPESKPSVGGSSRLWKARGSRRSRSSSSQTPKNPDDEVLDLS